jgi:hypothetical protein
VVGHDDSAPRRARRAAPRHASLRDGTDNVVLHVTAHGNAHSDGVELRYHDGAGRHFVWRGSSSYAFPPTESGCP